MNRRMVLYTVGTVIKIEAALMLLPTICALIYKEECITDFLISIAACIVAGFALTLVSARHVLCNHLPVLTVSFH